MNERKFDFNGQWMKENYNCTCREILCPIASTTNIGIHR